MGYSRQEEVFFRSWSFGLERLVVFLETQDDWSSWHVSSMMINTLQLSWKASFSRHFNERNLETEENQFCLHTSNVKCLDVSISYSKGLRNWWTTLLKSNETLLLLLQGWGYTWVSSKKLLILEKPEECPAAIMLITIPQCLSSGRCCFS